MWLNNNLIYYVEAFSLLFVLHLFLYRSDFGMHPIGWIVHTWPNEVLHKHNRVWFKLTKHCICESKYYALCVQEITAKKEKLLTTQSEVMRLLDLGLLVGYQKVLDAIKVLALPLLIKSSFYFLFLKYNFKCFYFYNYFLNYFLYLFLLNILFSKPVLKCSATLQQVLICLDYLLYCCLWCCGFLQCWLKQSVICITLVTQDFLPV